MLLKKFRTPPPIIIGYLLSSLLLLTGIKQAKLTPFEIAKNSVNKENILYLNANLFNEVVEASSRNYSVFLVFNALHPSIKCSLCKMVNEQLHILAKYAVQPPNGNHVFFAHLDYEDGVDIFDKRNIRNVPQMFLIPPARENQEVVESQFEHTGGVTVENLAAFIQKRVGEEFYISFPPDYVKIGKLVGIAMFVLAMIKLFWKQFLTLVYSEKTWASVTLVSILLMISGHMWNQIRHPLYVAQQGDGHLKFFVDTTQQQFGFETQVLSLLYGLGSFTLVSLVVRVPRMKNATVKRLMVVLWALVLFASFNFTCYLYRLKNRGYPFNKLLF